MVYFVFERANFGKTGHIKAISNYLNLDLGGLD
jgi:hypothetical protein